MMTVCCVKMEEPASTSRAATVQAASQVRWRPMMLVRMQVFDDVIQVSDAAVAGTFCEKKVCLKKNGCLEVPGDSSSYPTSHTYLLTLGLVAFTLC